MRRWSPEDIKPAHLVPNWPGLPDGRLDSDHELADQYVAHLSLIRAQTIAALGWSLGRMVNEALFTLERFTEAVESSANPAGAILRVGLSEAAQLKTRPSRT